MFTYKFDVQDNTAELIAYTVNGNTLTEDKLDIEYDHIAKCHVLTTNIQLKGIQEYDSTGRDNGYVKLKEVN